jgi:hypothetical protein
LTLTLDSPANGSALQAEFTEPISALAGQCAAEGEPVILLKLSSSGRETEIARTVCSFGQWLLDVNIFSLSGGFSDFRLRHTNALGQSRDLDLVFDVRLPGKKRFMTGFGDGVTEDLEPGGGAAIDLRGSDRGSGPRSFTNDLESFPFGDFSLEYAGGTAAQRSARLEFERGKSSNRVLRFALSESNAANSAGQPSQGRVQATLVSKGEVKELYEKVRVRLGPNFRFIAVSSSASDGIKIAELAGASLKIVRSAGGPGSLRLAVSGPAWSVLSGDGEIPIDQWFTLEIDFKPGDEKTGRLFVAITTDEGRRRVLIDDSPRRTLALAHGSEGTAGEGASLGLKTLELMKLEASQELLSPLKASGGPLVIEWDDLEIWTN